MPKILVLNPNSSDLAFAEITNCIAVQRKATSHQILLDRIESSPAGINSDEDIARVSPMVAKRIAETDCDAAVVACFSDPGVDAARLSGKVPVFGMAESAYCAAAGFARLFGIISFGASSVARHADHINKLGLSVRLGGDRIADLGGIDATDAQRILSTIVDTGRLLRDRDGAGALIIANTGLDGYCLAVQQELGIPVLDPIQAALAAAIAGIDLGYFASRGN